MKANVKKRVLVRLVCLITWFACTECWIFGKTKSEEDNQKPVVTITPMDAAVCKTQNITYRCNVSVKGRSKGVKDREIKVVFLTRNGIYQPVEGYRQINRYSSELTLSNVTEKDRNKALCCTFGMNSTNCVSEPSILNVYHSVQKLHQGKISPLDPDVCISQDITFSCTLSDPPQLNYSIGFAIKNESTNFQYVPVESRRTTVVNETLSELTLYNISMVKLRYISVRCYYWQRFGDIRPALQLGKTSTAVIYPMPRKVEEINCIVDNYVDSMNCSWNGTGYKEEQDIVFKWRIPENSTSWTDCQDLNKKYNYCYWNSSLLGDFTKIIQINITVSEPCGVEFSSNFTIEKNKIVKPAPVVDLKATVFNSTCIKVSWDTSNSYFEYPKEHKVVVTSKWGDNRNLTFVTTTDSEKLTKERMICELFPYTEYSFAVSIQPTGQQAGFYSNPRVVVARTYSDIPASSPTVAEGGYSSFQGDCKNVNDRRSVCVFWKPISSQEKNGPMKGLEGIFTPVGGTRHSIEVDWAEDLTSGCRSELLCNTTYRFTIWARNENGTSDKGSTLEIASATSGIRQPDFIVESVSTSEVYVRWMYPQAANTKQFMVVMCRNKDGVCENDRDVYWEYFPATAREAVLKIDSSNSAQGFLYGVSAIMEDGSSGVEWEDCVYLKNKVPQRQPKNVVVSAGSDDNTLVVTWDKMTCGSDEPYIAMYNLQFNKLSDTSKNSLNISSDGAARVVLRDLEEEQTYLVTIRAVTEEGHYGPESQPVTGVPKNKSLKADEIIGIALGTLILVLFAGVGCICALRKCKQKAERELEKDTRITIPQYEEDQHPIVEETKSSTSDRESMKSIERQNSDDSGICPMSPPPDKYEHPPEFGKPPADITRRPDDYVFVTTDIDRCEGGNGMSSALHSATTNPAFDDAVPAQRDATVGFILQDKIIPKRSAKKAIGNVGNDETCVKVRAKNESGDSGMSDAYSKATLGKSTERNLSVNSDYVDADVDGGDDENTVSKVPALNNSIITDYVRSCMSQNLTELHGNIPKPSAFSEYPDGDCSVLDKEDLSQDKGVKLQLVNDTGLYFSPDDCRGAHSSPGLVTGADNSPDLVTGADNSPDLVTSASSSRALSTPPNSSSGLDFSPDYLLAEMPDKISKNNQSSLSSPHFVPGVETVDFKLDKIPCPVVDGNGSSSTDGFLQAESGESTSSNLAETKSQIENSKPKLVSNNSDDLPLSNLPNASLKSNSEQEGDSAAVGMTLSLENVNPSLSVDPHTVQTWPNSYVDSEKASGTGSGAADGYLAHVAAPQSPIHEGHVTSCNLDYITVAPSNGVYGSKQTCDSRNYVPHCSVDQNQFLSSASGGSSSLSHRGSVSDVNDPSGYVSNCCPDPRSTPTSFENSDGSLESPTRIVFDPENGYVDQSQPFTSLQPAISSDFDQPVAGLKKTNEEQTDCKEYVDETFAQNRALLQSAVIPGNSDGFGSYPMGKTGGYVPHDFLSQGIDNERHLENGREPLVLRNLSKKENMEERIKDVSNDRDSDSGLGSLESPKMERRELGLERESPEMERRELGADNGYVSHNTSASMQL